MLVLEFIIINSVCIYTILCIEIVNISIYLLCILVLHIHDPLYPGYHYMYPGL